MAYNAVGAEMMNGGKKINASILVKGELNSRLFEEEEDWIAVEIGKS